MATGWYGWCESARMDRVLFCAKRTHFSYTTHANRRVREWSLTAGRIDLLVSHRAELLRHGVVYQSDLRARLAVTRATICIMLQRMEKLGLIQRRRSETDRRQIVVTVTAAGYAAFEKVRQLVDGGVYRRIVDGTLDRLDYEVPLPEKRARFLQYINAICTQLGDVGAAPYPAEPLPSLCGAVDDAEAAAMALLRKYVRDVA